MRDWDVGYHRQTAYGRGALGGGYLDWSARPAVYKNYHGLSTVALAEDIRGVHRPFFEVLFGTSGLEARPQELNAEKLGRILGLTYGITAQSGQGRDAFFYRSVPSAGALYPCELYAAVQGLPDLEDGLYHYDLARNRLVRLRPGRLLRSEKPWAAAFFVTAIFFRSSWKYRDRAYRYCLLDAGHLVENALLVLQSEGLTAQVLSRFDDEAVNAFLGLDSEREVCLAVLTVPHAETENESEALPQGPGFFELGEARHEPVQPEACRMSPSDKVPREILNAHRCTAVGAPAGASPRSRATEALRSHLEARRSVPKPGAEAVSRSLAFAETVWRRRSYRNYVSQSVSCSVWHTLWHSLSLRPVLCPPMEVLVACGDAEELPAGIYRWDAAAGAMSLVKAGDFRSASAHACLDQDWLRHALFHFAFEVPWPDVWESLGPRGYREAMLDAGRLGQRVYLASTALGLGACGIGAFYDDEVRRLFHLDDDRDVVYITASGPVKKLWK
ncbi:SagB/ThcOx family dehydrogenase [Desulfosoma sp.]